jgi:acetyl esterase/lipase
MYLEIDAEGFEVARLLADHGIAAFVLKYRTKPTSPDFKAFHSDLMKMLITAATAKTFDMPTPLDTAEDAENAVRLVRTRATQWGVDPHRVGFVGFSAGAITTLTMALSDNKSARPDFVASIYGPMSAVDVPSYAPPAFFALALDDNFFGRRSIEIVDSWRKSGRPVEAHLYMIGGHGFATAHKSKSSELWLNEFYAWTADLTKVTKN